MGKTRNTGKLATQIQFDNSNNLVIGTSVSSSFNTSGSVNATGGITGSIFGIGNPTSFSSSISSDLTGINNFTASNGNTSLNSFSASNSNTSLNAATSSYSKLSGGNTFSGTQIISGSTYVQGDLVVYGSSSIQYISASSVSIGTNIVNLNTATPAVRYAGLSVQDSGSAAGVTGSMLWDSCCNRWIYSNPSGVGYSGGVLMSGPRAATFGTETTLTCHYIAKSGGGDHLYDSCIYESGSRVGINTSTLTKKLHICGAGSEITFDVDSANLAVIRGNTTANFDLNNEGTGGCIRLYGNSIQFRTNVVDPAVVITNSGITCFSNMVCVPNLKVQSAFADLVLCGSNTTSPHLGSTFSITTNQDGLGRTIIGNGSVGRAIYLESNGQTAFNCGVKFGNGSGCLNYYQQGTFSPAFAGSTSGCGVPSGGNAALGYYTRIGNQVFITVAVNSATFPSYSGDLRMYLPFTAWDGGGLSSVTYHGPPVYFYPLPNWGSSYCINDITPYILGATNYLGFNIYGSLARLFYNIKNNKVYSHGKILIMTPKL
jgi:hypothetical protein